LAHHNTVFLQRLKLVPRHQLAEYLNSDNDSSDITFIYERNRITLALMRVF